MAKVVLDTNFILECVKNRVDFFEELLMKGHRVLVPRQVILEIERLMKSSKAIRFRENASLALKLIDSEDFDLIDISGRYVDIGLRNYCISHPEVVLATMDKDLKKSVPNRKMVVRNKKKLELQ